MFMKYFRYTVLTILITFMSVFIGLLVYEKYSNQNFVWYFCDLTGHCFVDKPIELVYESKSQALDIVYDYSKTANDVYAALYYLHSINMEPSSSSPDLYIEIWKKADAFHSLDIFVTAYMLNTGHHRSISAEKNVYTEILDYGLRANKSKILLCKFAENSKNQEYINLVCNK